MLCCAVLCSRMLLDKVICCEACVCVDVSRLIKLSLPLKADNLCPGSSWSTNACKTLGCGEGGESQNTGRPRLDIYPQF